MKTKRTLSLFIIIVLCLSSFTAFAADEQTGEKSKDRLEVFYNDEIINFDVEPIIENGRTLVPIRAIFEAMGCAVNYAEHEGKQIVYAHRGNDSLMFTIGENKMYFNDKEITLDVPAKIKNGRTLVPLRAISEAFECEVYWHGDTRTISINSPAECHVVSAEKLAETITDDDGNVLIEALAYYPVLENPTDIPFLDEINQDYKRYAEKFIDEARAKKEDALFLRTEMGKDKFIPFVYELTYEQNYNISGELCFTNFKYVDVGGAHPTTTMESRTLCVGLGKEHSLSEIIDENSLDVTLSQYVTNLFVDKLKEIDPDGAAIYTYDYVRENIGSVQFYITPNSVVLYCNQGEMAPYALGVINVEIPFDPELFYFDMRFNCLDEYVFEYEFDEGYEWRVIDYAEDKLVIAEETIDYSPEEIYSEQYPVGLKKVAVKSVKKGNAALILAHVKKGEGIETATQIYISSFYVDENNMLTLVTEEEAMYLINK